MVERIDAGIRQTFALLIPLAVVFGIHETAQLEVIEKSLFAMVAAGVPAYFAASIVAHAIIAKVGETTAGTSRTADRLREGVRHPRNALS